MAIECCQQLSAAGAAEGEYRLLPDESQKRDFFPSAMAKSKVEQAFLRVTESSNTSCLVMGL